jgi:hypothetical protein
LHVIPQLGPWVLVVVELRGHGGCAGGPSWGGGWWRGKGGGPVGRKAGEAVARRW